jgi:hypothetical protein
MIELLTALRILVASSGITMLVYSVAVLIGGGGAGDEDAIVAQIFIGVLLLLILYATGGVL